MGERQKHIRDEASSFRHGFNPLAQVVGYICQIRDWKARNHDRSMPVPSRFLGHYEQPLERIQRQAVIAWRVSLKNPKLDLGHEG